MALSFARPQTGAGAALQNTPMAEMNTTPLIDVMLVLLIMFIITIPIQTHQVGVDLPQGLRWCRFSGQGVKLLPI